MLFILDPDPAKEIDVDPDPEWASNLIWLQIRPNIVNPLDPDPLR